MTPERWNEVQALFIEVVDLEPEARTRRLSAISDGDPDLHAEVAGLLTAAGMGILYRAEDTRLGRTVARHGPSSIPG